MKVVVARQAYRPYSMGPTLLGTTGFVNDQKPILQQCYRSKDGHPRNMQWGRHEVTDISSPNQSDSESHFLLKIAIVSQTVTDVC